MLIIGLCMVFASTLVVFYIETAPSWLVLIANIVSFTGWALCTISWCSLTEKLKRIEKTLNTRRKDVMVIAKEKQIEKIEWISVDERLPKDGAWVLGYSAKSGRSGLCNCLKSYIREFDNYDETTHWLPLPEFPEKKGGEE